MRVLLFMENTYCGGMDTFVVTLVDNWPYRDDELVLVCNRNHPGLNVIETRVKRRLVMIGHRLPVHSEVMRKIGLRRSGSIVGRAVSFLLRYTLFVYYMIALPSLLLRQKADRLLVVAGGYPGGDTCRAAIIVWALFRRRPRGVFSFHNLVMAAGWHVKCLESIIDLMVGCLSGHIVTVSDAAAESVRRRPILARMKKVQRIYYGINPPPHNSNGAKDGNLKDELGLAPSSKVCLKLATYEPRKGHEFLLRAFRKVVQRVPLAHMVLCGHGLPEQLEAVRLQARRLRLENNVHIFTFREDTSYLLRNADILVMASQQFESFGLSCVEAMAHRVPVVATRVGGLPEVVRDGEGGFCVRPDDVDGYAARIVALLEDEALNREQGHNGYQRFKRLFTSGRMAAQYARLIRKSGYSLPQGEEFLQHESFSVSASSDSEL